VTVTIHDEGGSVTSSSAVTATVTVPSIGVSSKLYKANASFKSTPFTIAETLMYSNSNGTFNASLNFSDTTQGLSIPNCSTSPSASCRLTILGFQSAYTSSTAKAATIWARYVYTSGGSSVTRYARLDLTDADPSTADGISIRMSSAANPTLPATSPAAPTTYTGAVTIS
jgi:hypothetical protein